MYLTQNPVLHYELLTNLRRPRAFVLLALYVALLGWLVYLAWPQEQTLDLAQPEAAKRLVNLFFFGQYLLASLMTPSFAAGAITGEKERHSLEMLLASPLQPGAIVLGKLLASLCHLAMLMLSSLPIVMLCLPLGGVSPYEVLAAYVAMISSIFLFGMICLWTSSFFSRTSAALLVSYLTILPLVLVGVWMWAALGSLGETRLMVALTVVPAGCLVPSAWLWWLTTRKLLYPADFGAGGQEVVDLETEAKTGVGLVLRREEFPDRLFAPPKRNDLMEDGTNPVYDKEMRSEIFAQGTLMLRLVIQISMLLAIPLMAVCLFILPHLAPWYVSYVLLFNLLVGPVFSAGSVCSERERETLDLLLTTLITPWQLLWGKLLSGLRVSSVLTAFLLWPVVLASVLCPDMWNNLATVAGYFVFIGLACLTTALTALGCSTIAAKTSQSLIASYLIVALMFLAPLAARSFAETFFAGSPGAATVRAISVMSPFSAVFGLPLEVGSDDGRGPSHYNQWQDLDLVVGHLVWMIVYNVGLLVTIRWLFRRRDGGGIHDAQGGAQA